MPDDAPIRRVAMTVAEDSGISLNDILCARRHRRIARPRQVAMWLARETTPASLPQIGRALGRRDHTTIIHGCRVIDGLMARDPAFAERVLALKAKCEGA